MFQTQSSPVSSVFASPLPLYTHGLAFGPSGANTPQAPAATDLGPAPGTRQHLHLQLQLQLQAQHAHQSQHLYGCDSPSLSSCSDRVALHPNNLDGRAHRQAYLRGPDLGLLDGYFQPLPFASTAMNAHDGHDMAAQQEAAKAYEPSLEGPLVGEKVSSEVITAEYAKADDVYVEKTTTYSHYRPILGDGNCGWRAIGFSYFEMLVEHGNQDQVQAELARLMSMNKMLETIGRYDYFEDFAEEVFELLKALSAVISDKAAARVLIHQRWNDKEIEGSLIYYFRLIAATYLKANAETYSPFLPDGQNMDAYCSRHIEAVNQEIEHTGIIALVNVLLTPVNFVLEIAYLDRSEGSQVNRYRFPEETNGQDLSALGPIIYLLYRPEHYDILYCSAESSLVGEARPTGASIQVNRVSSADHSLQFATTSASLETFATADFDALSIIPGLSGRSDIASLAMHTPISSSASSSLGPSHTFDSPEGSWMGRFQDTSELSPLTTRSTTQPGRRSSIRLHQLAQDPKSNKCPIRFSQQQLEYESNGFPEPTFQVTTSTFKNSVWNRAHYGNPDFQPEEWNPDDDVDAKGRRKVRKDV